MLVIKRRGREWTGSSNETNGEVTEAQYICRSFMVLDAEHSVTGFVCKHTRVTVDTHEEHETHIYK